jgi:hypothetical protein
VLLRNADGGHSAEIDDLSAGVGLAEWKEQFGETIPDFTSIDAIVSAAMGSLATASAVPEPISLSLAISASLFLASLRRQATSSRARNES